MFSHAESRHLPGWVFFLSIQMECWAQPWTLYPGNNLPFLVARTRKRKQGLFVTISNTDLFLCGHFSTAAIIFLRKRRSRYTFQLCNFDLLWFKMNRKRNMWQLPQRQESRRWPWQRGAAPWGTRDASSWSELSSCVGAPLKPPHALWLAACTSNTWTLRRCHTRSRERQTWCMCS